MCVIQGGEAELDTRGESFPCSGKRQQGYFREGLDLRAFFKYSDYYPHTLENNPVWVQMELEDLWVRACPARHRTDIKEKHVLLPATIKLLKKKKKRTTKG